MVWLFVCVCLQGFGTCFAGTDADCLFDIADEDLATADAPGSGSVLDRFDRFFSEIIAEHDLDFHLGQKINDVFRAAIEFGVAFLAPEALGLGDRDALQPDLLQSLFDLVEFDRFDDCFDFFHSSLNANVHDAGLLLARRTESPPAHASIALHTVCQTQRSYL